MQEDKLTAIENKIDRMLETVVGIRITLAQHGERHEKNTADLSEHIRRTDLIESRIEQQDKINSAKLDEALLPIKLLKLIVAICVGSAAILGLFQLIKQVIGN